MDNIPMQKSLANVLHCRNFSVGFNCTAFFFFFPMWYIGVGAFSFHLIQEHSITDQVLFKNIQLEIWKTVMLLESKVSSTYRLDELLQQTYNLLYL